MSNTAVDNERVATAALAYKRVQDVRQLCSVWRPNRASNNMNVAPTGALESDALRDVGSWELVWNNAGSEKPKDYSLWRGRTTPSSGEYSAPRMGDLLTSDATFKLVWDDSGPGATNDGSVWQALGMKSIPAGAMMSMPSHSQPPQNSSLALDADKGTTEVKSVSSGLLSLFDF
ncbi:hypothetical protein CPB85DRAFT_1568545 [Mucidula mucida]|nr:hypothetical protein CPB85DRAFT_1568545 [Mucidula mucida]